MPKHQQNTGSYPAKRNFVFYYKKAEKIVSALYLVTQHLDNQEPLKWQIRQNATDLISCVRTLKDTTDALQEEEKQRVQQTARDLASLVTIARMSGLISPTNADVCIQELYALGDGVAAATDFSAPLGISLSHDFFDDAGGSADSTPEEEASPAYTPAPSTEPTQDRAQSVQEDGGFAQSSANRVPESPAQSPKPAVQAKKNQRQREILKLIREKGEISVRDAANVVPNCSEKTLQRELMGLVKEGVLKKEGKRRWTRYSFA